MRILLSHFVHPEDALEREAANGEAEIIAQKGPDRRLGAVGRPTSALPPTASSISRRTPP